MRPEEPVDLTKGPSSAVTEFQVSGMNCNNCVQRVTDAIRSVPGVRSASVVLDGGRASVRWIGGAQADVPAVLKAIKQAGYEAEAVATGADGRGERRHGGWHTNLWVGVCGTVPLMIGEWLFGQGMA